MIIRACSSSDDNTRPSNTINNCSRSLLGAHTIFYTTLCIRIMTEVVSGRYSVGASTRNYMGRTDREPCLSPPRCRRRKGDVPKQLSGEFARLLGRPPLSEDRIMTVSALDRRTSKGGRANKERRRRDDNDYYNGASVLSVCPHDNNNNTRIVKIS